MTSTTAATATLTIYTSAVPCPAAAVRLLKSAKAEQPVRGNPFAKGFALAVVLLPFAGVRRIRRRGWYASAFAAVFVAMGLLSLGGCGGSGSSSSTTSTTGEAPLGTYTLTVTGTDSTTTLSSTTTLTLTID